MSDNKIMKTLNGYTVYDQTAREEIEALKGAAHGLVFDTKADMETYIAENAASLKVGQDLYIRAENEPDYWWDGTAAVPVEAKTDLSGYATTEQVEKLSKAKADKAGWTPDKYIGTDADGDLVERDAPSGGGASFETGNALEMVDGVLNVKTTDTAEEDNTLPITSSGVHTIVGNIGAILDTI